MTVNIPSSVTLDSDTKLYIFNEQFNSDRSAATSDGTIDQPFARTDYASALLDVTAPAFIPVTDITMTNAASVQVNADLTLAATVTPGNATNKAVVWSVKSQGGTGAAVSSYGVFRATSTGTATVTATVASGMAVGTPYTKDFSITVTNTAPTPVPPVLSGGIHTSAGGTISLGNTYAGTWGLDGVLTVQADCSKLVSVTVDGVQLIRDKEVVVKEGSTILTFTPAYLATLKDGTHSIRVQFTDGQYTGTFTTPFSTVTAVTEVPATGDMPLAWIALIAAMALVVVAERKVRRN